MCVQSDVLPDAHLQAYIKLLRAWEPAVTGGHRVRPTTRDPPPPSATARILLLRHASGECTRECIFLASCSGSYLFFLWQRDSLLRVLRVGC